MSQIQVIDHQPDPLAARMAETGNSITETLLKQQALAIERLKLDFQAKNATSEIEKAKFDRKKQFLDMMIKAKELGVDSKLVLPLFKDSFGEQETIKNFAEFGKVLNSASGTPEQQKDMEQVNAMRDPAGYMRKLNQGLQGQDGGAQEGSGQPSSGGFVMPTIKTPVGDITDLNATGRLETVKTLAAEKAKKSLKTEDLKTALDDFLQYESQIPRHTGGLKEGAQQLSKLQFQRFAQQDEGIANAFFSKAADLAKYVARRVDVGNLSRYEQVVAKNLVPTAYDSQQARDIKIRYLQLLAGEADAQAWDGKATKSIAIQRLNDIVREANMELGKDTTPRAKAIQQMREKTGQTSAQPQDDEYQRYLQAIGAQ